jgi:hypothetical protein
MSEGGEQKPKTLIICKKHTISYDHICLKEENNMISVFGFCSPPSDIGDHS